MTASLAPATSGRAVRVARFGPRASLLLDALRGGAAQVVVLGHAAVLLDVLPSLRPPHVPYLQDAAVVVFFLLSGLLITHSVRAKLAVTGGAYRASEFVVDRVSRIYTAYLPVLAVVAVADALGRRLAPQVFDGYAAAAGPGTWLANLLMLQDFPGLAELVVAVGLSADTVTSYGTARPLWTVAVEWWIYLAVAALLVLRRQLRRRSWWLVPTLLPAAVATVVPAVHLLGGRGNGLFTVWLLGAAISYLWPALVRTSVPRWLWLALGTGAAVAACAVLLAVADEGFDLRFATATGLALAFALAGLVGEPRRRGWGSRLAVYVASYSFTLYLVHYTVMLLIRGWLEPSLTAAVVLVVGSNLVAMAVAAVTERHYPLVRRRLRAWLLRDEALPR